MTAAWVVVALLQAASTTPWLEFSDWFSKHGTPGAPAEVIRAWGNTLGKNGLSPADVQVRTKAVAAYVSAHPRDALVLHFNRIYTWADAPFTREPSALVKKVASTLKPGRALDIAMGQGRNSVWLARAGWKVSGYDISDEALRQAMAAATNAGVKLDTRLASHDEYELGKAQWDLILMSFAFTDLYDAAYMQRVYDSLKPGGMLLIEGFSGGSGDGGTNAVLRQFIDYQVRLFEDLPDVSDWGRMKAPLMRMALVKPSAPAPESSGAQTRSAP